MTPAELNRMFRATDLSIMRDQHAEMLAQDFRTAERLPPEQPPELSLEQLFDIRTFDRRIDATRKALGTGLRFVRAKQKA